MSSATRLPAERSSVVLIRSGEVLCALPLQSVIETLRCPPIRAIPEAPAYVRGVAIIRGAAIAMVDLGMMFGAGAAEAAYPRVVTVRAGTRVVGLLVDRVIGVRELHRSVLAELPPLLQAAHPGVLLAVGMLDGEFLMMLEGSRMVSAEALDRLENPQ